jgi:glycine/D-amino acid oxidase-like deaminating enzyme
VPDRPGLSIATGHYRNGIHLCLWTARALVRATLDGDASGLEPFRPERFAATVQR